MASLWVSSGHLIDPMNIDFSLVGYEEFCHGLSLLNRYTGNTRFPYPVAQHTALLHDAVPSYLRKAALIHDFPEILIADLPHPVKLECPQYVQYEKAVLDQLADYYNVGDDELEELKDWDRRICADEMLQVFEHPYISRMEPLGVTVKEQPWQISKSQLISLCRHHPLRPKCSVTTMVNPDLLSYPVHTSLR